MTQMCQNTTDIAARGMLSYIAQDPIRSEKNRLKLEINQEALTRLQKTSLSQSSSTTSQKKRANAVSTNTQPPPPGLLPPTSTPTNLSAVSDPLAERRVARYGGKEYWVCGKCTMLHAGKDTLVGSTCPRVDRSGRFVVSALCDAVTNCPPAKREPILVDRLGKSQIWSKMSTQERSSLVRDIQVYLKQPLVPKTSAPYSDTHKRVSAIQEAHQVAADLGDQKTTKALKSVLKKLDEVESLHSEESSSDSSDSSSDDSDSRKKRGKKRANLTHRVLLSYTEDRTNSKDSLIVLQGTTDIGGVSEPVWVQVDNGSEVSALVRTQYAEDMGFHIEKVDRRRRFSVSGVGKGTDSDEESYHQIHCTRFRPCLQPPRS
jgi:hypothetical protein